MTTLTPELSELGKKATYDSQYNPDKLFPIPRKANRDEIGVPDPLPFFGYDLWNHYEVSWLNQKGKPIVALAEIIYGCDTHSIIESKSLKLYFNSFNNTPFQNEKMLEAIIKKDIELRIGGTVHVKIIPLDKIRDDKIFAGFSGECIDHLDIECTTYSVDKSLLKVENTIVQETLFSNLLKANCLVTHQPDWASVQISYKGKKLNRENLLKYLVSFRNHNEFHEQCIERIFMDILQICKPEELTVYGRFTRRGGLDINPYRSTKKTIENIQNLRLFRQ